MMASRLSVLNAFSRYSSFSLVWVYGDATPLQVKQHLYKDEQSEPKSHHRATHHTPTLTLATSSSHKQNRVRLSHYIHSQALFRAPPPRVLPGSFPRYGSLLELLQPLHYSNLLLQCLSHQTVKCRTKGLASFTIQHLAPYLIKQEFLKSSVSEIQINKITFLITQNQATCSNRHYAIFNAAWG